jgi:hypothetical protein
MPRNRNRPWQTAMALTQARISTRAGELKSGPVYSGRGRTDGTVRVLTSDAAVRRVERHGRDWPARTAPTRLPWLTPGLGRPLHMVPNTVPLS